MTFKLIYTADLHGNEEFYKRLLKKAENENVNAIVIGGDLCPRDGNTIREKISNQKLFLENFMISLFKEFRKRNKNIDIYVIMGNDDFRINLKILENAEKNKILKSIHDKSIKLNKNFNIAGYSFVNPTPFRLKDWEKPDFENVKNLLFLNIPENHEVIFDNDKMPMQLFNEEIRSIEKENGTIQEDLTKLKKLSNPKKIFYVIHAPPFNTKLDIITTGAHVGSKSIREFIEKEKPLLTLHGHIHESPKMSGSWKDKISNTICINVGSSYPEDKLNCVIIDLGNLNDIKYFELKE
ncbi:metallophosphoesterase [Candidatus Woesearchaeota archaeon]|nr:metallophosphoesterase [Candidatus Woesearchaeota archaeon]